VLAGRRTTVTKQAWLGHPSACPAKSSTSPNADEPGVSSDKKECAVNPANKARAATVLKRRFAGALAD